MSRSLALALACLALVLPAGCGGGKGGGGGGGADLTGPAVFLNVPVLWVDNDSDSVISGGDFLVFSFDRPVAAGANPPAMDIVVGGGGGEVIVAATWTDGFLGDNTKLRMNVAGADVLREGKLDSGTTFNLSGVNTITNVADGTVGATPAITPTTSMGRIHDTGQNLGNALAFSVAMLDVDGDGDKDVILGTTGNNLVLENQGLNTGFFQPGFALNGEMVADTRGIGIGLVDGVDTVPDLVAANTGVLNANRVYLASAPGQYTTTNTVGRTLIGTSNSNGVFVTDWSAFATWDGLPGGEMFVANNGQNMVYYANVAGNFNGDGMLMDGTPAPQPIGNPVSDTRAVVGGDIDGNGVQDVVTADDNAAAPGTITVYLVTPGAGTQLTFSSTVLQAALSEPRALALCDVDGDTDLDVVAGFAGGRGMQVWVQTDLGTGTFGLPNTFPGGSVNALTCTDVDGDRVDDIIQGRAAGQGIVVFINCDGGTFRNAGVVATGTVNGLAQAGSQTAPAELFSGFDGAGAGDFVTVETGGGVNRAFTSAR